MRTLQRFFLVAAVIAAIPGWAGAQAPASAVEQEVDRITAREKQVVKSLRQYNPIIETYVQDMRPDKELGAVPVKDHYFLGTAYLSKGIVEHSMIEKQGHGKMNVFAHIGDLFASGYVPEGFLQMIFVDAYGLDRQHYQFDYIRREFLGEVRCFVFDVTPLKNSGKGRFKGRIWVEDQDSTIVRFNGIFVPAESMFGRNVHFDSWRVNVLPGVWVPAYIYSEETDLKDFMFGHVRFKAQTRLWGYDLKHVGHQEEFSELTVESQQQPIKDQATETQDRSPIEAERAWNRQAETNVIDRLQLAGLLAPQGEVDKVMETVINNLEVTNNLDIQPEVHCRVLLTSTLESFSIGHTIVLSRGLLDVLPDEANLAAMLAHELGHVMLGHPFDSEWAFNDKTMFPIDETLRHFNFHSNQSDEQMADQKAVEILKKSPYRDKLTSVGLFMKQLDQESKALPALVSSHMGNRVFVAPELTSTAPQVEPAKLDQIAALPLGSRVKLDPWSDRVEMLKAKPANLLSERDKMPFQVTPFYPYLTRKTATGTTSAAPGADATKPDVAKKEQ
jgi:hypothetical protein